MKRLEDSLHFAVADYLRRALPPETLWLHIPNGAARAKVTRTRKDGRQVTYSPEGVKLQRMGALAGAPDILIVLPNGQCGWVELKTASGQLSEPQVEFRTRAVGLGCGYAVCRSPEEVEATITRWLAAFGLKPRASLVQARFRETAPLLEGARA